MKTKNIILAGAAPDTANLGVNALCYAAAANLVGQTGDIDITILGHGKRFIKDGYSLDGNRSCDVLGAKNSRRFYEPSSFKNISFVRRIPFVETEQSKIFSTAAAVADISGGDSFSDIYGLRRFEAIIYPKKLAMEYGIPLILLPQTYGPFEDDNCRKQAQKYVKYASFAFARDNYSFEVLKSLLGDSFDPKKHRQAVDVAFILPFSDDEIIKEKGILPEIDSNEEIFGLNVSGLIYNDVSGAKSNYHISIDYNGLVLSLVKEMLAKSTGKIWLIPHVLAHQGHVESDVDACNHLKSLLPAELQSRVTVISGDYDQCDIKGVIKHCSWFCGTRMHSTIAALSCEVPTVGLAYSGKFKGVFASVGQEKSVVDTRGESQVGMFNAVMDAWENRESIRQELKSTVPLVKTKAKEQMKDVIEFIVRHKNSDCL